MFFVDDGALQLQLETFFFWRGGDYLELVWGAFFGALNSPHYCFFLYTLTQAMGFVWPERVAIFGHI